MNNTRIIYIRIITKLASLDILIEFMEILKKKTLPLGIFSIIDTNEQISFLYTWAVE